MSSSLSALFGELQQFSHLQQLHNVLSKDLRACRDRVLKETTLLRKELTFYRWCMRKDLDEPFPFPSQHNNGSFVTKSMDYDRLLFYRKLICYLHAHPTEFSQIIVSLPTVKHRPEPNSLQELYFDQEVHLAECIAFDIMLTDIHSLTLLLRSILLHSQTFNTLSQKLFQLFIVITCQKLLNTTFRQLLNRLYKINEPLSFQMMKGAQKNIVQSTLYDCCDDVLRIIIEVLRILPVPLRQCIIVLKQRLNNSPSLLLEWLVSTIFSPLLLQPDDWYLVICNPAHDEGTNNNNIQCIVTTLLQLCRTYQSQSNNNNPDTTNTTTTTDTNNIDDADADADAEHETDIMTLLLRKHGGTLTMLLQSVLDEKESVIVPSEVLVPSNATPELFIWHKIFLKMDDADFIPADLQRLCASITPPKISHRPWITIQLPTIDFKMRSESDEQKTSGSGGSSSDERMMSIGSDDFTKQPKSKHLGESILKPLRVFLLSLTEAQSRALPLQILLDDEFRSPLINLNTQQITLVHETRHRIRNDASVYDNLAQVLSNVVAEYRNEFCNNLREALSTHNVLSSLNYIQNKESILKELRIIAVETHENLQMRDILLLSKRNIDMLRPQIEKISASLTEVAAAAASQSEHDEEQQQPQQQQQTETGGGPQGGTSGMHTFHGMQDGSDWMNDKFVVLRTSKCISKIRNALIRFLNDYGIGRVDFKRKFGGSVLDFGNKRISTILVNAIIFEIGDIFWSRCPIEDGKFKFQIIELNSKFATLTDFILGFLSIPLDDYQARKHKYKLPKLSEASMNMMISKLKYINDAQQCVTIADFEDCICTVRDSLVACINGADSAGGDDYMPLFCYILMKGVPSYLPSQLQTCKVISQRKQQDKYFIDCCVAMKALRNFCNVLFKTENENDFNVLQQQQQQQQQIVVVSSSNTEQNESQQQQTSDNLDKKSTPSSLFSQLRSKLPQRSSSKNNRDASPSAPSSKKFFGLSPTSSFSSFMKKNNSASDNEVDEQHSEHTENNSLQILTPTQTKMLQVPQTMAPPKPPSIDSSNDDGDENVKSGQDEIQNVSENENANANDQDNDNENLIGDIDVTSNDDNVDDAVDANDELIEVSTKLN